MFKLVVLCALVAAVNADPKPGFFAAPALAPAIISPAVRILPAPYVYPQSPLVAASLSYSSPLGYAHYIKKRSVPLALNTYSVPSAYIAPASYAYSSPIAYSAAAPLAPAFGSGLLYSSGAHFIKKRSLLPSAYIAPSSYIAPISYAAAAPLVASTYSTPVLSTPLISAPISHLIKKRSAPLALATYTSPASYSHESRVEFKQVGPIRETTSYLTPGPYTYPIAYNGGYY